MDLENGEIHESEAGRTNLYRKLVFDQHRITMPAEQFSFQQSTPGGPRGDRELSTNDMLFIVDSLKSLRDGYWTTYIAKLKDILFNDSLFVITREQYNNKDFLYVRVLEKAKLQETYYFKL
jgi:hypothetical protein